jgi:hypothetical protein
MQITQITKNSKKLNSKPDSSGIYIDDNRKSVFEKELNEMEEFLDLHKKSKDAGEELFSIYESLIREGIPEELVLRLEKMTIVAINSAYKRGLRRNQKVQINDFNSPIGDKNISAYRGTKIGFVRDNSTIE